MTFPLVVCKNVHIFPGVPSIMRLKFEAVAERFRGEVLHTARVVTGEYETDIAERLEQAVERFRGVSIGSYPRYDEGPRHVIVTMEGLNAEHVAAARVWLEGVLKPMDLLT
jgi:molybdopterin-biosynthesis enzyme MoeA-like protein